MDEIFEMNGYELEKFVDYCTEEQILRNSWDYELQFEADELLFA